MKISFDKLLKLASTGNDLALIAIDMILSALAVDVEAEAYWGRNGKQITVHYSKGEVN
jgi:hypothetical protein